MAGLVAPAGKAGVSRFWQAPDQHQGRGQVCVRIPASGRVRTMDKNLYQLSNALTGRSMPSNATWHINALTDFKLPTSDASSWVTAAFPLGPPLRAQRLTGEYSVAHAPLRSFCSVGNLIADSTSALDFEPRNLPCAAKAFITPMDCAGIALDYVDKLFYFPATPHCQSDARGIMHPRAVMAKPTQLRLKQSPADCDTWGTLRPMYAGQCTPKLVDGVNAGQVLQVLTSSDRLASQAEGPADGNSTSLHQPCDATASNYHRATVGVRDIRALLLPDCNVAPPQTTTGLLALRTSAAEARLLHFHHTPARAIVEAGIHTHNEGWLLDTLRCISNINGRQFRALLQALNNLHRDTTCGLVLSLPRCYMHALGHVSRWHMMDVVMDLCEAMAYDADGANMPHVQRKPSELKFT